MTRGSARLGYADQFMRARLFAISWLGYARLYPGRKNLSGAMACLQNEGGLDKFRIINLLFIHRLMHTLDQFVMGPLADRIGVRHVVGIGLLIAARAHQHGHGPRPPSLRLLVLGMSNDVGQSADWPGLVQMMAAWFLPAGRGVAMAWRTTSYLLGGFLAIILASWLLKNSVFGLDSAVAGVFILSSLLLILLAALLLLLARNRPTVVDSAATPAGPPAARAFGQALRRPVVRVAGTTAFLLKVMRYSFLFWLPLRMVDRMRYADDQAGYASAAFELVGFAGTLAEGCLFDKVFDARRFPVARLMLLGSDPACFAQPSLATLGCVGNVAGIALIWMMFCGLGTRMQGAASQDAGAPESASGRGSEFAC